MHDERRVRLSQIAPTAGYRFRYVYDLGDGWLHTLAVEKILPPEPGQQHPVCMKGKRACPPEDVGGIWGYAYFLQAIRDPKHPEHDRYVEWIGDPGNPGGRFDPEAFDLEQVNRRLRLVGRCRK
jgi:hypothetical protein